MPVRNAMPFLDEAIASILAQTHGNFELVICDDGSTDGSSQRMREWAARDARIRLERNDGPGLGPAGSSNWAAGFARHALVARMDADDIAMPDRLRREVEILRAHPDVALVATLFDSIDSKGRTLLRRDRSILQRADSFFPAAHGSFMYRRHLFEQIGGYRAACDYWEDLDLFVRFAKKGRILILPEALYRYRFSGTSARRVADQARVVAALELGARCIAAYRAGGDYEDLLADAALPRASAKVAPSVARMYELNQLWSDNPGAMLGWARTHLALDWDRDSARTLAVAAWGRINPWSLRTLIRLRREWRDRRAGRTISDATPYDWPGRSPVAAPCAEAEASDRAPESLAIAHSFT